MTAWTVMEKGGEDQSELERKVRENPAYVKKRGEDKMEWNRTERGEKH